METIAFEKHLLENTVWEDGVLLLPPEGGGFALPGLSGGARWLCLELEVLGAHSQAFEARFFAAGEETPRVIIRFGIMNRLAGRVSLDLDWLDGHILFPGHLPGSQKIVCHGSRIAREEIARAELRSMPSFDPVRVRFDSVSLRDQPLPAMSFPRRQLIDRFGQYAEKDWPGKIASEEALTEALRAEAALPAAWPVPGWTPWGGDGARKLTEATGYFGKTKRDGRWYLTDPSGCAFFSLGADCVAARCDARIDGLESLLSPIPSPEEAPDLYSPLKRPFGETPREGGLLFSYERLNLTRAFGKEWESTWQRMVTGQLMRMGINTLGNWSDEKLYGKMPYVTSLPEFPGTKHLIFRDFPDVLSPEYRREAARCAGALLPRREDPWMIGYFLRNEPAWAFVDGLIIADEVLRDPAPSCCKEGLIAFLEQKYGSPRALSAAWGRAFSSFDDLRQPIEKASALSDAAREDLRWFSARLTEEYMRVPADACRAADPNHMILGMRWAWISDPLLVTGWDAFDVFSINCYAADPTAALENVRTLGVDLPVMIGEFHFGALDAGPTATGLEAVATQRDRADAFRYYCERAAAHPLGAGCHWFQYCDQFALGRFDGENYNIGLFDITLRPYPEMQNAVRACAGGVYAVSAGERASFDRKPESLPMIAY